MMPPSLARRPAHPCSNSFYPLTPASYYFFLVEAHALQVVALARVIARDYGPGSAVPIFSKCLVGIERIVKVSANSPDVGGVEFVNRGEITIPLRSISRQRWIGYICPCIAT